MTDYLIRLAWPSRALSPNARVDRRSATPARKAARTEGWAEAKRVGAQIAADAHLEFTFYPPNRARRDLDNLFSSMKAHRDGIASAAGVDDESWSFSIRWGEVVKDGAVLIHVHGDDAWQSIGGLARNMIQGKIE